MPDARGTPTPKRDFPVLFEPAMRLRDPSYGCSEPAYNVREPSDQLVIYQALRVIRRMTLIEPLPRTDSHPYDWSRSKIGAIGLTDVGANPALSAGVLRSVGRIGLRTEAEDDPPAAAEVLRMDLLPSV